MLLPSTGANNASARLGVEKSCARRRAAPRRVCNARRPDGSEMRLKAGLRWIKGGFGMGLGLDGGLDMLRVGWVGGPLWFSQKRSPRASQIHPHTLVDWPSASSSEETEGSRQACRELHTSPVLQSTKR